MESLKYSSKRTLNRSSGHQPCMPPRKPDLRCRHLLITLAPPFPPCTYRMGAPRSQNGQMEPEPSPSGCLSKSPTLSNLSSGSMLSGYAGLHGQPVTPQQACMASTRCLHESISCLPATFHLAPLHYLCKPACLVPCIHACIHVQVRETQTVVWLSSSQFSVTSQTTVLEVPGAARFATSLHLLATARPPGSAASGDEEGGVDVCFTVCCTAGMPWPLAASIENVMAEQAQVSMARFLDFSGRLVEEATAPGPMAGEGTTEGGAAPLPLPSSASFRCVAKCAYVVRVLLGFLSPPRPSVPSVIPVCIVRPVSVFSSLPRPAVP